MRRLSGHALLVLCCCSVALGKLGAPGGARKLHHNVTDSFKVMESFVYAVAILDSDHDDILECWSAKRTEIDRGAHTATYVLAFPTTGEEISFHVKAEENSPEFSYTLDNDSTPKGGMFYFTDYKDCVIEDLEFNGHRSIAAATAGWSRTEVNSVFRAECVLWTRRALKDSVPQPCIDQFVDTCGAVVPKHSRDLCNDGEGDY
ncbi:hypothetical protein MRX96_001033 [Rhipicephalus microplus]